MLTVSAGPGPGSSTVPSPTSAGAVVIAVSPSVYLVGQGDTFELDIMLEAGSQQVDYVRVGLSRKPGIQSVALKSWDRRTGRAIFWVRLDASVKENLGYGNPNVTTEKMVEAKC